GLARAPDCRTVRRLHPTPNPACVRGVIAWCAVLRKIVCYAVKKKLYVVQLGDAAHHNFAAMAAPARPPQEGSARVCGTLRRALRNSRTGRTMHRPGRAAPRGDRVRT